MNKNLFIIQDLDGVCMGLVCDLFIWILDFDYINVSKLFVGYFYVLINGEYIGGCGLNQIVDIVLGVELQMVVYQFYLLGLVGGGV